MQPFGLDAVELLRVEAGLIMVGVEFQGGDVSPYDLSLDRSILLGSDAEFVGRPALAAVAGDPPNRLKTVVVQGDDGARVRRAGVPRRRGRRHADQPGARRRASA